MADNVHIVKVIPFDLSYTQEGTIQEKKRLRLAPAGCSVYYRPRPNRINTITVKSG